MSLSTELKDDELSMNKFVSPVVTQIEILSDELCALMKN